MSADETNGHVTATSRRRRRAAEACTFCRRRKIKCSAEKPTCASCKTHGTICQYEPASIDAVQHAASRPRKTPRTERAPEPAQETAPRDVSRIVVASNGSSSYHGRTSTLFDEASHDRVATEARPHMPDEWIERGLVAEAARQRQLETVNFRHGKLEFDGVEPELGMHLLSLHWNRQHHSFLTTYRPAFMRDMACGGPYFSKLLLNAIYFGASKFSPRREVRRVADDVRTAGWQFRQRVRELLGGALDKSEITTIQALLVMTNSLFALGDERSAAWLYAGLAFRMIVDLGIHVDTPAFAGSRRLSDEDSEIRRRVFWAAFVVDKIQSLYQGRPVSMKESDTLVPMKFQDTYEELEHWTPFSYSTQADSAYLGSPAYSISTFRQLCQLSVILSDILSTVYTERSFDVGSTELSSKLEVTQQKLVTWRRLLPEHLVVDVENVALTPPPHVLSLHALYGVLTILLHRPFVADGHLYNTSRAIAVNSFMACATAADDIVQLLRAYDKAFGVQRAPYLISYATYVAATIHARIAARRGPGSQAHSSLETCLAVFRKNQETNWAVRRASAIIQNLMMRLGVATPDQDDAGIDRDIHGDNHRSSVTDAASSRPMDRERSLQSMEIDGIIQSFVQEREQETSHVARTKPTGPANPSYAPVPGQSRSAFSTIETSDRPHENPGTWMYQDQQQLFNEQPVTVDDLLFGFNGSDLDNFPLLDWE